MLSVRQIVERMGENPFVAIGHPAFYALAHFGTVAEDAHVENAALVGAVAASLSPPA